jgi:hypothetical protein
MMYDPAMIVRPLRAFAGDLAEIGRAIGATAARARTTFRPHRFPTGPSCEAPGCGAPATHPCLCEPVYCARHYAEAIA